MKYYLLFGTLNKKIIKNLRFQIMQPKLILVLQIIILIGLITFFFKGKDSLKKSPKVNNTEFIYNSASRYS
jgi:hypothetical protein